jgi:hypothetical protein
VAPSCASTQHPIHVACAVDGVCYLRRIVSAQTLMQRLIAKFFHIENAQDFSVFANDCEFLSENI